MKEMRRYDVIRVGIRIGYSYLETTVVATGVSRSVEDQTGRGRRANYRYLRERRGVHTSQ